jgi:hypothetical protein
VARVVLSAPALVLLLAAQLAACSLDWSLRSADPGDAALVEGSTTADAADAPVAADAADGSVPTDAPISAEAAACRDLETTVAQKRTKARQCQLGAAGQCTTTVKDECGCDVVVTSAGATTTTDYSAAVSKLIADCGKPPCLAACPQNGVPGTWACLVVAGETRCSP